jgi:hypothetical protein
MDLVVTGRADHEGFASLCCHEPGPCWLAVAGPAVLLRNEEHGTAPGAVQRAASLEIPRDARPGRPVRPPKPARAKVGTGCGRRARREGPYAAGPRAGRTGPGRSRTRAQRRTPWRARASHARDIDRSDRTRTPDTRTTGQGPHSRRIAKTLFITEKTVSVHVTHILEKLQVTNRSEAGAIARGPRQSPR